MCAGAEGVILSPWCQAPLTRQTHAQKAHPLGHGDPPHAHKQMRSIRHRVAE